MARLGRNLALAREVVERLRAAGVATFCLCPGGRNAPLVEVLSSMPGGVEVLDFFEERSAAYFALGRARRDGRPSAVVTTSGTAAAELLPAMVEAFYECVPLVAVTADRPRSYRGTGAPQAIEQRNLFGVYACPFVDLDEAGGTWPSLSRDGPSHVNVSSDEPLPAAGQEADLQEAESAAGKWNGDAADASARRAGGPGPDADATGDALRGCLRPLVLLGALAAGDCDEVLAFCRRVGAPVLAETSSRLKPRLGPLLLRSGETTVRAAFDAGSFDSVIRVGDVPSCRLWRDLDSTLEVPVLSISRKPWSGLTRGMHVRVPAGSSFAPHLPGTLRFTTQSREDVMRVDVRQAALVEELLTAYPRSEPSLVRELSRAIPRGSFVYLGNSQPIREWNDFAVVEDGGLEYGENRGANGIDGQLSTFFGAARETGENWAVVGDLTALYDLSSPWALRHVTGSVRIVVINNGGGRIFERMFDNERFQNRHTLTFGAWAALWGLDYRDDVPVDWESRAGLVELRPDEHDTQAFWQSLRERSRA